MPRIFTVILFIFCINCLSAQQKEVVRSIFWKGDTLPHVWLEEVSVRQKNKNAGWFQRQHRRQTRLFRLAAADSAQAFPPWQSS